MERVKLGEICKIVSGSTPKTNVAEYWDGDVDWITPAELTDETYVVEESQRKITDIAVQKNGLKPFPKGTVILSSRAPIGKVAIAGKEMYCNQGFKNLICSDKIDSRYLYWYLKSKTDYLNSLGRGATFKEISKSIVENIEIFLPDLQEQITYSNILEKCQNVILLQKKQLGELDALIKSRFIEMFGELLLNPMAWNEYPLGAVCDKVVRYPTFYGMEYLPSGTRVIRIGNILPDGHMELDDENYVFVYDTVNEDFPETVIELNDIIMAVRGDGSAAKRIGIITEPSLIDANISPNLIRIKVNNTMLNPIYLFYYLTGEVGQKRLDAYVNKTAKKNVAAKDIVKIVTPVPPLPLQNDFASFVHQVDKLKVAAQETLNETQKLFNSLMQQYFG